MTTATISNTLTNPDGSAVAGVPVIVELYPDIPMWGAAGEEIVSGAQLAVSDGAGHWSASFERTDTMPVTGMLYRVTELVNRIIPGQQPRITYIDVPGAGPYTLEQVQQPAPSGVIVNPNIFLNPAGGISSGASSDQLAGAAGLWTGGVLRGLIRDAGGQVFNVMAFGAVGNGIHDDTAAWQAAINAAIAAGNGTVFIPAPSVAWVLSSTLNIAPISGNLVQISFKSAAPWPCIVWKGGSNTSIFKSYGWKISSIENMVVEIPASLGVSNVVVWDVDTTNASYPSTGRLVFTRCEVIFGTGNTNCVAWRLGHSGTEDASFMTWIDCIVTGNVTGNGHIAWVSENQNVLVNTWITCGASNVAKFWTNSPTSGSAGGEGGDTATFIGCGGSDNNLEFEFKYPGNFAIYGGRWEVGAQFLSAGFSSVPTNILISGVSINGYTPPSGILFDCEGPGTIHWQDCSVLGAGVYALGSNTFFMNTNVAADRGRMLIENVRTDATTPFWTVFNGGSAEVKNCVQIDPGTGGFLHFVDNTFTQAAATTAAAGANAGTSPPAPVVAASASDRRGTLTCGTGTGPAAGALVAVTFGFAYQAAPIVTVVPLNAATAALGTPYITTSTTGFTINVPNAPSAGQANTVYAFAYQVATG